MESKFAESSSLMSKVLVDWLISHTHWHFLLELQLSEEFGGKEGEDTSGGFFPLFEVESTHLRLWGLSQSLDSICSPLFFLPVPFRSAVNTFTRTLADEFSVLQSAFARKKKNSKKKKRGYRFAPRSLFFPAEETADLFFHSFLFIIFCLLLYRFRGEAANGTVLYFRVRA